MSVNVVKENTVKQDAIIADENLASNLNTSGLTSKKKRMMLSIAVLIGISVCLGIMFIWQYLITHESTDDAFIDGHASMIGSRVSGTVESVFVEENQFVKQGDLLACLDPKDYELKVEQASAEVKMAQRQVEQLQASLKQTFTAAIAQQTQANGEIGSSQAHLDAIQASIAQNKAAVAQASMHVASMQARQHQASLDWERYKRLDKNGAVSHRELEQAHTNFDDTTAQLEGAKDALRASELKVIQSKAELAQASSALKRSYGQAQAATAAYEQNNVVDKQKQAALATLEQAQAKLKQDLLQLSYCEIHAPIAGRIGKKNLEIGQHVEVGQTLLSIFASHPWITANFKETQIGRMRIGQSVEIKVDTFPDVTFKGCVESIAPASGAKYALLPPENATGNFTKIVQRIPVRIAFDAKTSTNYFARLAPGMSCEVTVIIQ